MNELQLSDRTRRGGGRFDTVCQRAAVAVVTWHRALTRRPLPAVSSACARSFAEWIRATWEATREKDGSCEISPASQLTSSRRPAERRLSTGWMSPAVERWPSRSARNSEAIGAQQVSACRKISSTSYFTCSSWKTASAAYADDEVRRRLGQA
jgi:hypothetical protein